MISSKRAGSKLVATLAFSSIMLLSGCSWLKIDTVADLVDYRGNSSSIASLEIPPGLTAPVYDPSYTIQRPVVAADVPPPNQTVNTTGQTILAKPAVAGLNSNLANLKDGNPVLAVAGSYDQVWSKTAQALPRIGLTILSQQYEQGTYTVTSTNSAEQEKNKNVISRFMSYLSFKIIDGKEVTTTNYRFVIADRGQKSLIVVSDEAGKPAQAEEASALLARLKAELAQ